MNAETKLCRIIHRAALTLDGEKLRSLVVKAQLVADYQYLMERYRSREPFNAVRHPAIRDYFICLFIQNKELKKENDRLRKLEAKLMDKQFEGAFGKTLQAALAPNEAERDRLFQEAEQIRIEHRKQKQIAEKQKEIEELKKLRTMARDRAPKETVPVDWFAPMPIFHNTRKLFGYCQATGQTRRRVTNLLQKKKACPLANKLHADRGKPKNLYGFEVNMMVLDEWLGRWLPQNPNLIANTILDILCWQATADCQPDQHRKLRRLLFRHWQRVILEVTDEDILQDKENTTELFNDDKAWNQFTKAAKRARSAREAAL